MHYNRMSSLKPERMLYRYFGHSGLQVSAIPMGQLLNFTNDRLAKDNELIRACLANGINHFDTAQIYSGGKA